MQYQRLIDAANCLEFAMLINYYTEQIVITECKYFSKFTNMCFVKIATMLSWELNDHDIVFGLVAEYVNEELWGFEIYRYDDYTNIHTLGKMIVKERRKLRVKRTQVVS